MLSRQTTLVQRAATVVALVALASLGCATNPTPLPPDASMLDAALASDARATDVGRTDGSGLDAPLADDAAASDDGGAGAADAPSIATGVPFGPFALMNGATGWDYGPAPFTLTLNFMDPGTIVASLDAAYAAGVHLVLAMTGGSHDNYITGGAFDRALWDARMARFDTPEIRAAVAARVADGTILAASVMDEPDHVSWGGVMTGAIIDSMSDSVKAIFPTLPTATVVQLDWEPTYEYASLDFLIRQFSYDLVPAQGPDEPNAYRDRAIEQAGLQHVGVFLSMNILDGGSRVAGCPTPETGGPGTYGLNCRMTPAEVEAAADALTTRGTCGLLMWESNAAHLGDAAHVAAFTRAATLLAGRPWSCAVP